MQLTRLWQRRRTGATMLVLMAACAFAVPAAADDPHPECGDVLVVDTTLSADLKRCENGLTLAEAVTLDLGGHSISGAGGSFGVRLAAPGARVVNGAVRLFEIGIEVAQPGSISTVDVSRNAIGIASPSPLSAASVDVQQSEIHHNGTGLQLLFAHESTLRANSVHHNAGDGIFAVRADGSLFDDNSVTRNGATGLHIIESTSRILGNTLSGNGGDGLLIQEDCGSFLNLYRIGSNVADRNGGLGINISLPPCPPGSTPFDLLDAGGNAAKHNGDVRECLIVECAKNRGQANKLTAVSGTPARPD